MVGPSRVCPLLPALQGSLLQRSTQTEAFQEAPQWVSESPLDEGQSKQGQTCSEPHSGGCRCPLPIPLVRFSSECSCGAARTSLFQPAREARCLSAATLTVSSSPAHASQAGQGHNPHGPGPGKYPRRSQHHPLCSLHTCHGLLCPGREGPRDHSSGDTHPGPRMGFCPARSRTLRDCKMKVTPVVALCQCAGAHSHSIMPCSQNCGPADPSRGKGPSWEAALESRDVQSPPLCMSWARRNTSRPKG